MKIELLTYSPEKLSAMSDKQLTEILSPYFPLTRPDQIVRETKHERQTTMKSVLTPEQYAKRAAGLALAKKYGIKL